MCTEKILVHATFAAADTSACYKMYIEFTVAGNRNKAQCKN